MVERGRSLKKYDVIVIGSGTGMIAVNQCLSHGLRVALVDKGPLGGTCPNLGCIPSKMLIFAADRAMEVEESRKLGIEAEIKGIVFSSIMERMRRSRQETQERMRESIARSRRLDFYEGEGHFVADYTLEVKGQRLQGKHVFIASGSRPLIPPIKGLDGVDYLTSESVLQLRERPESLIIIGGGYIGVEYGHFFAAMGTKVAIVEMADRLVAIEEPEISELLKRALSRRMTVFTGTQVEEIGQRDSQATVLLRDPRSNQTQELAAQRVMVATGRRGNADLLKVENTGVEADRTGFVKVNGYLETTRKNIFAFGDADGNYMFTHMGNREAALVADNLLHGSALKMDYKAAPHAVFSHPQIASVGLTEEAARKDHAILVGRAQYSDVAAGEALVETEGFAKAIVDKESSQILGFHIIGPYASILIQEVVNAMASGGHVSEIYDGIHIHPALPELIPVTLSHLEEPDLPLREQAQAASRNTGRLM